jgi:TonB family protein
LRAQAVGVNAAPRGGPGGGEDGIGAGSDADTRVALLMGMFDELWWGGVRVDPEAEQKRLVRSMMPDYPAVARDAGIEGDVALRVWIGKDGAVTGMEALSGEPVLVRAAMRAVEQWRYQPGLLMGRPVNVVTTVMLAFRLR